MRRRGQGAKRALRSVRLGKQPVERGEETARRLALGGMASRLRRRKRKDAKWVLREEKTSRLGSFWGQHFKRRAIFEGSFRAGGRRFWRRICCLGDKAMWNVCSPEIRLVCSLTKRLFKVRIWPPPSDLSKTRLWGCKRACFSGMHYLGLYLG